MKYAGLLILIVIICQLAAAQSTVLLQIPLEGKNTEDFIPEGYDTLLTVQGDLNKDNIPDLVMVLNITAQKQYDTTVTDNMTDVTDRLLIVLLKKENGWWLGAKSTEAVLCKDCGGIFGDPFAGITIQNGILVIHHYGGSAWRWSYTHRFRYQNNDFYLIGKTKLSYWNVKMCEALDEFAGTEYEEVNLLTGRYEVKRVSAEGCKLLEHKKGKRTIKPLIKLNDFSIEP